MAEVESKSPAAATGEAPKQNANSSEVESSQFPAQGPSGQPFPPPNFAFYNYPPGHPPPVPPPGADGNPDPNTAAPNGEAIPYPPGMYPYVYPTPPPGYMPVSMSGMPIPGALIKPKRKQVKMACTNCAAACKRCDVNRPCERCIKYGLADSCKDGVRKERKKGFKRGPYNKHAQQSAGAAPASAAAPATNPPAPPEWPNGAPPPFPAPPAGFPPPPEGYYPAFYMPPPGAQLVAVPPGPPGESGEAPPEGAVDPNVAQSGENPPQHPQPPFPPHAQFVYGHLPPGYPFYFPPPHPQQPPPQPPQQPGQQPAPEQPQQQEVMQPAQTQGAPAPTAAKKGKRAAAEETIADDGEDDEDSPPTPPRKKRGRRSSDADWPGGSKRSGKKSANAAPTRRSTRRGADNQPHVEDGVGQDIAESVMNAANHDIVGTEDPVVRSHA